MKPRRWREIRSADNAHFKQLRKLAHTPRERRKRGLTLLDGPHLLQALADAGGTPEELLLRRGSQEKGEIAALLECFPEVPVVCLDEALFDALSPVEQPAGIAALHAPRPKPPRRERCAVLLDRVQDPANVGAILRTCAAAGVDAVHLSPGCAEAWSPKVLRAAMGAHFVMAIFEGVAPEALCERFEHRIATCLDGERSLYETALHSDSIVFMVGNEGTGLAPELAALATERVHIPMPGAMESLNVAAATAVCLFERVRQRQAAGNRIGTGPYSS